MRVRLAMPAVVWLLPSGTSLLWESPWPGKGIRRRISQVVDPAVRRRSHIWKDQRNPGATYEREVPERSVSMHRSGNRHSTPCDSRHRSASSSMTKKRRLRKRLFSSRTRSTSRLLPVPMSCGSGGASGNGCEGRRPSSFTNATSVRTIEGLWSPVMGTVRTAGDALRTAGATRGSSC